MIRVAALYVDPRGPYPRMPDVEAWDESRDARTYPGPHHVVAHPPCGSWGRLRHLSHGRDRELALIAVEQVRRWGGVLEHPAWSQLWRACDLPWPGEFPDPWGGWCEELDQVSYGHVARKRTWIYVVGVERASFELRRGGTPTHWIGGGTENARSRRSTGKPVPAGVKLCSRPQRVRTPTEFARALVELAARCTPPR